MPGLDEPMPRDLLRGLREVVLTLRETGGRRGPPPDLWVGRPGRVALAAGPAAVAGASDPGCRLDLVRALLARPRDATDAPMVWLTRSGPLEWQDLEAAWLDPALRAFGEVGLGPTFVVVTRGGWYDPRSEVRREWVRLRRR